MRFPRESVPETITVRPALASQLSGLRPYELMNLAEPDEPGARAPIATVRTPRGTEFRLDDILFMLGTFSDSGLLRVPEEDPPF